MSSPFKRVCCQATWQVVRQPVRRHFTIDGTQWHTTRPLSTSSSFRQAQPVDSPSNLFLTAFSEDSESAENLDPDYEEDDISALGHRELDQHRELREMVRLAAWEMPLLSSLQKPFEPPDRKALPLRWRYTTYMGEQHPAQSKVVVQFRPSDLPDMTDKQREKLMKVAGPRYNPLTNTVKMSCENFETQAQNKRYLGDTIQALIAEAKNPNADSFEDIPLDTRHVKRKPHYLFPAHWLLTDVRKEELDSVRRQELLRQGQRIEQNLLVSGEAAIEYARQADLKQVEAPIVAQVKQPMQRGKMGQRDMGQWRTQR